MVFNNIDVPMHLSFPFDVQATILNQSKRVQPWPLMLLPTFVVLILEKSQGKTLRCFILKFKER